MNSQPLSLSPGQIFAGQFRVERALAQGGMGAVYVVEQLSTGKKRALKLMLPSAALLDGSRRFEQEARTSSLIPSEHVVDVISAGIEGDARVPWLAMELLEGETLEAYLCRSGPLSPVNTRDILAQMVHALGAAHDLGIVHRDLKPDNLFLAQSRRTAGSSFMVKVLDFGLAMVVNPSTRNTTAIGSPLWMAPEQCETDKPIALSTDVWPFGLLAFRMLSGHHYWRSVDSSLPALMRELLVDELRKASQRVVELGGQELPAGFDAWFSRCVTRDPAARFQHIRAAWQELQPLLEPRHSTLPPPSEWSRTQTQHVVASTAPNVPLAGGAKELASGRRSILWVLLALVTLGLSGGLLLRNMPGPPKLAASASPDEPAHLPPPRASSNVVPSATQQPSSTTVVVVPTAATTVGLELPKPTPATTSQVLPTPSAPASASSKQNKPGVPQHTKPTAPLPSSTADARVAKPAAGVPDLL